MQSCHILHSGDRLYFRLIAEWATSQRANLMALVVAMDARVSHTLWRTPISCLRWFTSFGSCQPLPDDFGFPAPCGGCSRTAEEIEQIEQVRRPSEERTLQPRDINTRKVGPAEPLMSRRRQHRTRWFRSARTISAGYGAQHALKEKCGTRETRLGRRRRGKVARISRRRNRALPSGSPRGTLYR